MDNNSYITIQGWMINELGLKGNDLMIYAIIYGFSQDGESKFTGSLQYLADWCGATKQGVQKNLKHLEELGYITKEVTLKNGIRFCSYSCIPCNIVVRGIQHSCTNKLDNKLEKDIISKDIIQEEPDKPKRKSLFEKCQDKTREIFQDEKLINALDDYLPIRLAIKDKPIYGVNQWTALLNRLKDMSGDLVVIVNVSIERGWASFYQSANQSVNHPLTSTPDTRAKFGEDRFVNNNRLVDGGDSSGISF